MVGEAIGTASHLPVRQDLVSMNAYRRWWYGQGRPAKFLADGWGPVCQCFRCRHRTLVRLWDRVRWPWVQLVRFDRHMQCRRNGHRPFPDGSDGLPVSQYAGLCSRCGAPL